MKKRWSTTDSSGVGQINEAISQLDRMTQENAALVQQSTSSAASLRQQAERMVDVVGVFKFSEQEAAAIQTAINDAASTEYANFVPDTGKWDIGSLPLPRPALGA